MNIYPPCVFGKFGATFLPHATKSLFRVCLSETWNINSPSLLNTLKMFKFRLSLLEIQFSFVRRTKFFCNNIFGYNLKIVELYGPRVVLLTLRPFPRGSVFVSKVGFHPFKVVSWGFLPGMVTGQFNDCNRTSWCM